VTPSSRKTRSLVVVATRERTAGRAVLELADPDSPSTRLTLWPGLAPPEAPLHPMLAPRITVGRLNGEPVWLEARPRGVPLNRLAGILNPHQVALVLQDCCEALSALHEAGRVHGDLNSKRVVVAEGGWTTLVGVGLRSGFLEEDLSALMQLGRTLTMEQGVIPFAWTVPKDAEELRVFLQSWMEGADEDELRHELAALASAEVAPVPHDPTVVEIVSDSRQAPGAVDEVLPELGPDRELTGSWDSTAGEVTCEAPEGTLPLPGETTQSLGTRRTSQANRMQVLARILAPPEVAPNPARFQGKEGLPCEGIRALVLQGRLDPLCYAEGLTQQPPLPRTMTDSGDITVTRVLRPARTLDEKTEAIAQPPRRRRPLLASSAVLGSFVVGALVGSLLLHHCQGG